MLIPTDPFEALLYALLMALWFVHTLAFKLAYDVFLPDASKDGLYILALLAAILSVIEVEVVARLAFRRHLFFNMSEWSSRLVAATFLLGLGLACLLYFPDLHAKSPAQLASEDAARHAHDAAAEQARSNAEVQRLVEQFRQQAREREAAKGTKPVRDFGRHSTTRPSSPSATRAASFR